MKKPTRTHLALSFFSFQSCYVLLLLIYLRSFWVFCLGRYDSIPDDLKSVEYKSSEDCESDLMDVTQTSSRASPIRRSSGASATRSNAVLRALSRYMYNQRWIWKMSCQTKALPDGAIAGVLYALTKYFPRYIHTYHFLSVNHALNFLWP